MNSVEFVGSLMDRLMNENEIINDIIDQDFRRIQRAIPQDAYDSWAQIHSKMGRKNVSALLQKIGSSVLELLGPAAQHGLADGIYKDALRSMEHRYEEQEMQIHTELQEMLLESIHHRNTKPYHRRIVALVNVRGKLYSVHHASGYNKK